MFKTGSSAKRHGGRHWGVLVAVAVSVATPHGSVGQTPEENAETLFENANTLFAEGGGLQADKATLREVREVLDRIVSEYPASNLAVHILLQDTIEGLDVGALDTRLTVLTIENAQEAVKATATSQQPKQADESKEDGQRTNAKASTASPETSSQAQTTSAIQEQFEGLPERSLPGKQTFGAMTEGVSEVNSSSHVGSLESDQIIKPTERPEADTGAKLRESVPGNPNLALKTAIGLCYEGAPQVSPDKTVVIGFKLGVDGRLEGLPTWEKETSADAEERRLYLKALVALEDCAPYVNIVETSDYEMEIGSDALRKLRRLNIEQDAGTKQPARKKEPAFSAADQDTEKSLGLFRKDIGELQARLLAMGFDPNGIDGILGKGTRKAISLWQTSRGIPTTGFLDRMQYEVLKDQSESAFETWSQEPKNTAILRQTTIRKYSNGIVKVGKYYRGRDGCLRIKPDNRRGSILFGRSKYCNLRALGLK